MVKQLRFNRPSDEMRQQMQAVIDMMIGRGALSEINGLLKPDAELV